MSGTLLKVKHFGPIKSVEIRFNRFTIFIGPQAAGKSTLAKLYSTFLWMEKRLVRGLDSIVYFEQYSRFRKKLAAYHRLESYFYDDTEITFYGRNYTFIFKERQLSITPVDNDIAASDVVKVMYVPSERNYLSSVGNMRGLKSLPESLYTFKDEYEMARQMFSSGLPLPIEDVRFEFDKLNNIAWLVGKEYRVRLTDASSGFQAVTPLLLVSNYLTDLVTDQNARDGKDLSVEELENLRKEVQRIIDNPTLSNEVREAALSVVSRRYRYSGLVNIVEEPEENLYPESQKRVLYALLALAMKQPGNELLLTTHSPYMINFLTLAIKAFEVVSRGGDSGAVGRIVPADALVNGNQVSIYQLEGGRASLLETSNGLPSDSNNLNNSLMWANVDFDRLLDIEEEIEETVG